MSKLSRVSGLVAGVQELAQTHPVIFGLLSTIIFYIVYKLFSPNTPSTSYPITRSGPGASLLSSFRTFDWFLNGPKLVQDGFDKYPKEIFQLPSQDRTSLVLPSRLLEEVRNLPSSIVDNHRATADFFVGSWSTMNTDVISPAVMDSVKTQYIAQIGEQVSRTYDEALFAFQEKFQSYPDWTPVKPQKKLLELVAQTVARTIVGPEICRDPRWVESMTGYAENVFYSSVMLKMVPSFLRPVVSALAPFLYRVHSHRRRMRKILGPAIMQRLAWKRDQPDFWRNYLKTEQLCTLDWLVDKSPPETANVWHITHGLVGVGFGASHATAGHIMNCLLDLAADYDQNAPVLREEIDSVLGPERENLSNADLSRMWKLDSFMKESLRFHPPSGILSVNRTFLQPHTLSSGETVPAGVHTCFAGVPMSLSDEFLENARSFDAFRFERMRQAQEQSGLQFAASHPSSLHFGHGKIYGRHDE